jgi:hypothetical protein
VEEVSATQQSVLHKLLKLRHKQYLVMFRHITVTKELVTDRLVLVCTDTPQVTQFQCTEFQIFAVFNEVNN